ncbi:hypothetical protein QN277_006578 [Acacia crassicarpa]|uniref:Uncharacterized protein n=1 Tax=Acacia crassicarpa TaxID=499986 RepID=A0AAE1ISY3_9FABA|nr:hypothetical protein QN277_006578 [Acacia crassicarpa]
MLSPSWQTFPELKTVNVDHLVNNAGIVPVCLFEHSTDVTNFAPAMDINFWGSVYTTYFAIPHLRKSRGKIVGITSSAGWLPAPRMMFYNASKAAVINLYECHRTELEKDIGITIVCPGLIESEMTQGKFLSKEGRLILDQEMRDAQVSAMPVRPVALAAKAIVNGACRGDSCVTEPGPSERETINKKLMTKWAEELSVSLSVREPKLKPN